MKLMPRIEGAVDDANRVVVVGVAPGAEHHRAEAQLTDLDPGTSEFTKFHVAAPYRAMNDGGATPPKRMIAPLGKTSPVTGGPQLIGLLI